MKFKCFDTVEICETNSKFDGSTVTVVGHSNGIVNSYIVQFDFPQRDKDGKQFLCCVLPEQNLQLYVLNQEQLAEVVAFI